jgi:hypothetical protein
MIVLDGSPLSVEQVLAVARNGARVEVGDAARRRMAASRALVDDLDARDEVVYGVTTGFGALADRAIEREHRATLQAAVVRSHAAGMGPPLDVEVIRGMLLLRARTLCAGYSGVRPVLVEAMVGLLNAGVLPYVPELGSLGASGDLAPLAHAALCLLGEGWVVGPGGASEPAGPALAAAGLRPVTVEPKEGLALINGTDAMTATLALAVANLEGLLTAADCACAMSVEALLGTARAYDEEVVALRPAPGQQAAVANLRRLLAGAAATRAPVVAVIGGDNSLTRPALCGLAGGALGVDWGLLTLHAHHDVRAPVDGPRNGTPVRELIELGLPGERVAQVGLHGFANAAEHVRWARRHGVHVRRAAEVRSVGMPRLLDEVLVRRHRHRRARPRLRAGVPGEHARGAGPPPSGGRPPGRRRPPGGRGRPHRGGRRRPGRYQGALHGLGLPLLLQRVGAAVARPARGGVAVVAAATLLVRNIGRLITCYPERGAAPRGGRARGGGGERTAALCGGIGAGGGRGAARPRRGGDRRRWAPVGGGVGGIDAAWWRSTSPCSTRHGSPGCCSPAPAAASRRSRLARCRRRRAGKGGTDVGRGVPQARRLGRTMRRCGTARRQRERR